MAVLLAGSGIWGLASTPATAATQQRSVHVTTGQAAGNPFCKELGTKYRASAGAQMFCFGPQTNGAAAPRPSLSPLTPAPGNVNAANPNEDVSPSGVRAYGQSETSVAAAGPYVVEAWNDATGFFASCPSPQYKEELTGLGFSSNGGKSFLDLGGLPNINCGADLYEGDPSVEAYQVGGRTYFYISSLFDAPSGLGASKIALDACEVIGTGSRATLSCSQPVTVAVSSTCETFSGYKFCGFLDKDFLSIDPTHGRLYATYDDFILTGAPRVELSVCDLGNAAGGPGYLGGTPARPVCEPGSRAAPAAPYLTVARSDPNGCENEGAYPAVDSRTGDVYVAYEHNWATNSFGGICGSELTTNVMNYIRASCLTLTRTSACTGPTAKLAVPITSMDNALIPGYNRSPANDFPRLAVSDPAGTVSMVWNDARAHGLGDILMQSFDLRSLALVQSQPVRVNAISNGGLNFMPALRNANPDGRISVSWYQRATPTTAVTNVEAAIDIAPRLTKPPAKETLITTVASNWDNVSSDIVPNFGDYTDNYVSVQGSGTPVTTRLNVAWSDGRIGVPQPFYAGVPN